MHATILAVWISTGCALAKERINVSNKNRYVKNLMIISLMKINTSLKIIWFLIISKNNFLHLYWLTVARLIYQMYIRDSIRDAIRDSIWDSIRDSIPDVRIGQNIRQLRKNLIINMGCFCILIWTYHKSTC